MIITENGPQSIDQIKTHFELGSLFLSPEEYQRESVWDRKQKQLLIDTVFSDLDMPKFYLWKISAQTLEGGYPDGETKNHYRAILTRKRIENDDPEPYIYEVVDGQQRIRTFLEYAGVTPKDDLAFRGQWREPFSALADTPIARDRMFSQLNAEQQIRFKEFRLNVMVLENATIDQVRELFLRLQNGTPLNAQQKRDAKGSAVGRTARELSEMPFFAVGVPFASTAGDHRRVASQMLLLDIKDKVVSCSSRQLDKLYDLYKSSPPDTSIVQAAKRNVRILSNIFPNRTPGLNRSYALTLYWIISRITRLYEVPETEYCIIGDNFRRMDSLRLEAMQRDFGDENDEEFEDLTVSMSHGTDGLEKQMTRHQIVSQYLFENVNLTPRPELDPKRLFSEEEKLLLYRRAKGHCQISCNGSECGKFVDYDECAVDHIVPHSSGGRTELSNGRITHRLCNIARGTSDTFNPLTQCHHPAATENVSNE